MKTEIWKTNQYSPWNTKLYERWQRICAMPQEQGVYEFRKLPKLSKWENVEVQKRLTELYRRQGLINPRVVINHNGPSITIELVYEKTEVIQ